jgi:methylenetetrahydrofolate reductase (NADPH)
VDVVTELCQTLLDNGAPGLHFYTLNHAEAPLAVWKELAVQA